MGFREGDKSRATLDQQYKPGLVAVNSGYRKLLPPPCEAHLRVLSAITTLVHSLYQLGPPAV